MSKSTICPKCAKPYNAPNRFCRCYDWRIHPLTGGVNPAFMDGYYPQPVRPEVRAVVNVPFQETKRTRLPYAGPRQMSESAKPILKCGTCRKSIVTCLTSSCPGGTIIR